MKLSCDRHNIRLEVFLREELSELSRRRARALCAEGAVLVNDKTRAHGFLLKPGDKIELRGSIDPVTARAEVGRSRAKSLNVLYEDKYLVAINKPAMMHSVTLTQDDPVTLADCIAARWGKVCLNASADPREAGLVQRLDFSTSGVIVAAKSPETWERLHQMMLGAKTKKTYLGIVEGHFRPKHRRIVSRLIESKDGKKMTAGADGGAGTISDVYLLAHVLPAGETRPISLVKIEGKSFVRHQIRAHLALSKHPLVGDSLYGSKRALDRVLESVTSSSQRFKKSREFFLHAEILELKHPNSKQNLRIVAPYSDIDLKAAFPLWH